MSVMSVRQAAELDHALARSGWTPAEVKILSQKDMLANVLSVIHGHAKIVFPKHIIDCDVDPVTPDGWSVEKHQKGGQQFQWDAAKVELYLASDQRNGKRTGGNLLYTELANKPVLNANVLDFLLEHPHLIPEEWKDKLVFFWGTVYRYLDGYLYIRHLHWFGNRWTSSFVCIDEDWDENDPAAVRIN